MAKFIITLFFGMFGVHKFMENKIGIGVLYFFTLGLFGIGYIIDVVKAFINLFDNRFSNQSLSSIFKMWTLDYIQRQKIIRRYKKNLDFQSLMVSLGIDTKDDINNILDIAKVYSYKSDDRLPINPVAFANVAHVDVTKGKVYYDFFVKNMLIFRGIKYPYRLFFSGYDSVFDTIFELDESNYLDIDSLTKIPTLYEEFTTIKEGLEFEAFVGRLMSHNGYRDVTVTQASNDYGIDVIAYKDDVKYAVQCKYYSSTVGNEAVQQVVAGKQHYGAHVAVVATNNSFTKNAIELARSNNVILWDRVEIIKLIDKEVSS